MVFMGLAIVEVLYKFGSGVFCIYERSDLKKAIMKLKIYILLSQFTAQFQNNLISLQFVIRLPVLHFGSLTIFFPDS